MFKCSKNITYLSNTFIQFSDHSRKVSPVLLLNVAMLVNCLLWGLEWLDTVARVNCQMTEVEEQRLLCVMITDDFLCLQSEEVSGIGPYLIPRHCHVVSEVIAMEILQKQRPCNQY